MGDNLKQLERVSREIILTVFPALGVYLMTKDSHTAWTVFVLLFFAQWLYNILTIDHR
jgi:hypothetical protein